MLVGLDVDAAGRPVLDDGPTTWDRVGALEADEHPRWVFPDGSRTYRQLLEAGISVGRCHDIALVERILLGRAGRFGEPSGPAAVLARRRGVPAPPDRNPGDPASRADAPAPSLFDDTSPAPVVPVPDLVQAAADQQERIGADGALRLLAAAESASSLAAAEMSHHGLPWRAEVHESLLAEALGPRPQPGARPKRLAELADSVTRSFGFPVNPDSAADLREAFRRTGFTVESTRAWVLREIDHPAVPDLLAYKELQRLHSANGWNWLDEWVHDGRFRPEYVPGGVVSGRWASKGGGALQIPRAVRAAVVADPDHVLVVADAAQLEPRVLAAVSGDPELAAVSAATDLYTALAADGFGGDRAHAKTAMLGAMYGATTGEAGRLVSVLERRYPIAMGFVRDAARAGERGGSVRSVLGRASPRPGADWQAAVDVGNEPGTADTAQRRGRQLARDWGRFTRNFVVQGSAADWASVWLSAVRLGLRDLNSRGQGAGSGALVFFQHDELIVHVPTDAAHDVVELIGRAARTARDLVFPGSAVATPVHPVVVGRYIDAK